METTPRSAETVADLIRQYPKAISVFKKHRVDFCCRGNRPFELVCAELDADPVYLRQQIMEATEAAPGLPPRANEWSLDFLADYIQQQHHAYVRSALPELTPLLDKVTQRHGDSHPELADIQALFADLAAELTSHMQKEEMVLFPAIRKLVAAERSQAGPLPVGSWPFGTIQNPIRIMEDEHTDAGDNLAAIRSLTQNFRVPEGACYSFQLLWQLLEEFETDLHQHIHLENNILFPKTLALEKQLTA